MKKYYYAGGARVAMRVGSTLSFLLTDHLGSTAITASSSGAKSAELRYKAWGEQRYAEGVAPTDFRYTGQRLESLLGLHDYGARWYDSYLNRWTSPDPIVPEKIQGVQAWDRYAYANNNPVRFNDPSGHCIGPLLAVCIAAATFIADNAAAITAVALTGAIMSFVGPSNPDPQLINDPVASQQALENSAFQALGWLTLGQASLEFSSIANPSVPVLPDRTNPKDKTTGILIAGGEQTTLISGRNGPASQMPPGASGYDIVSRTHVEGHASALMTQNEWTTGTLWQNNIPCTSCTTNLPRMLPTNTTLRIIVPGEYDRIFKGR
jgi:RHS repeat-associated protein